MAGLADLFKSLFKNKNTDAIERFSKSLDYNDLPKDWANNKEIVKKAEELYKQYGTESPFFKAWWNNSQIPLEKWYHGTPHDGIEVFDPSRNRTKSISGFFSNEPSTAQMYQNHETDYFLDASDKMIALNSALEKAVANNERLSVPIDKTNSSLNPLSQIMNNDIEYARRNNTKLGEYADNFIKDNLHILSKYNSDLPKLVNDPLLNGNLLETYIRSDLPVEVNSHGLPFSDYADSEITKIPNYNGDPIRVGDFANNTDNLAKVFFDAGADSIRSNNIKDGVPWDTNIIAIKNPNQIKSTNNRGTFNPNDNNIYRGLAALAIPTGVAAAIYPTDSEASGLAAIKTIKENDKPLEDSWNPVESLVTAPIDAVGLAGYGLNVLTDLALSNIPYSKFFNSGRTEDRDLMFGE